MSHSGGPPEIEGMTSLKVDNLTYRTKPEDLHKVFSKYGDVGDVYIPRDRYSKESRGFAFVRFYDKRDAEDAMDYMDGAVMDGRDLRVQMARYGRPSADYNRRPRSRYDRGGGGGGGGGRYGGSGGGRRGRDSRSRSRSRSKGRRGRSRSRSPRRKSSPYRRRRSPSRSRSRSRSASHHSHSPAKRRSASRSRSRSGSKSPRQKTRSRSRSGSYAKGD